MHSVFQYVWHWLTAVDDHSLQAPFVYNFYSRVISSKTIPEDSFAIEKIRKDLVESGAYLTVTELGAQSRVSPTSVRNISDIAKRGISSKKTSLLLYHIIHNFGFKNIIELGTSFGINTMYLALDKTTQVTTFEGCPSIAGIANEQFSKLSYDNIELVQGNIDSTLKSHLETSAKIDLAFIDANHRLAPTLKYFELLTNRCHNSSILVFDDIHWSKEMSEAWKTISNDPRVTLSLDMFNLGLVFFRPELTKMSIRLR